MHYSYCASLCKRVSLFSLSPPNQSRQSAAHLELGCALMFVLFRPQKYQGIFVNY